MCLAVNYKNQYYYSNNLCMHSITQFAKQLIGLGMVSYFSVKPKKKKVELFS